MPVLALILAQHSSLQHEVIHGHPTRNRRLNEALVFPALGLLCRIERFRDLHLAHHYDPLLTDPHDDPETNYLDPAVWARLRRPVRAVLAVNNTLLGRMLIGPFLGMVCLWRDDLRALRAGDRRVARAWLLHAAGIVPVVGLARAGRARCRSGPISSAAGWRCRSCASGPSSSIRRTSGPGRAASSSRIAGRWRCSSSTTTSTRCTTPIRGCPGTGCPPSIARRREEWLRRNGGYAYRSYAEVFAPHFLRRKDPVAHPIWTPPEPGPRGLHPVSGRPLRQ